ncbi:MAG: helix-turn-helix domain-containing protein [Treponema sp.]|nr:helix-turn-helix domain-containing protein [Treponema sp.]
MIPMTLTHERLKAVREALQLSQRFISREIYTAQSVYARMETGKQEINDRTIELICYRFNVNREYLREGKDVPMFLEVSTERKSDELYKIFGALNRVLQDCLIAQAGELLKAQERQDRGANPS